MNKDDFYKSVTENNGCLEWKRYLNKHGYGYINYDGKSWSIHRLSYFINYGEIPKNKWVLHKCDNRKCVNPSHLYLGDNKQNVKDRVERNRGAIAERNASSKLKIEQVILIKSMQGTLRSIAEKFNVGISTIDDIKRGRTWKYV